MSIPVELNITVPVNQRYMWIKMLPRERKTHSEEIDKSINHKKFPENEQMEIRHCF